MMNRATKTSRLPAVFCWTAVLLGLIAMSIDVRSVQAADDTVRAKGGQPYMVAAGRSPIPQPGERITTPIKPRRLVDDAGDKVQRERPDGPVGWGAAHNYVGMKITVEGTIVNTYNHRGNVCFLNFHEDWRGKFYIPVFDEVFDKLPEAPEKFFLNKTIRVTGKVKLHNNRPCIEVQDIGQIQIVK